jgi:hypothetical protein
MRLQARQIRQSRGTDGHVVDGVALGSRDSRSRFTRYSAVAGVPPEVTDLNIELEP